LKFKLNKKISILQVLLRECRAAALAMLITPKLHILATVQLTTAHNANQQNTERNNPVRCYLT